MALTIPSLRRTLSHILRPIRGVGGSKPSFRQLELARELDRRLTIIDVGCRWGLADTWEILSPWTRTFGFDPDRDECDRLQRLSGDRAVTFVPLALGASPGRRTLYLTQEPACSSLYRPDKHLTSEVSELAGAIEVGKVDLEVTTLDLWAESASVGQVDFMKLDTQGSELDILQGGKTMLTGVRALEVEVEFNPIYESQPLFGDVDSFLRSQGFVLWRLSSLAHYSRGTVRRTQAVDASFYDSRAVKHRTRGGQLYWGHAHYFRREIIESNVYGDKSARLRDAFIAEALGFSDLASRLSLQHP